MGRSVRHREGYRSADWALLDFGGFIVHVFSEEARRYYDLERLWRTAPKLEIADAAEGYAAAQEGGARRSNTRPIPKNAFPVAGTADVPGHDH